MKAVLLASLCFLAGLAVAGPLAAAAGQPAGPPALLTDTIARPDGPVRLTVTAFSLPAAPAGRTLADLPGHRHPGHVYVYMLEGRVRSQLDDGPATLFGPGTAWKEAPGQLHRILNPDPGTSAKLLVVTLDPAGETR